MPPNRPQLSITLPRNFTFHYTDGQAPKTPERELDPIRQPSPPVYRLRRRPRQSVTLSSAFAHSLPPFDPEDVPVPTIEASEPPEPLHNVRPPLQQRASEPIEGYLAPAPSYHKMSSPRTPRTPTAQLTSLFQSDTNSLRYGWGNKAQQRPGGFVGRPMSSCSDLSDSSESSSGTWASFPSLGESCTTPDSEAPEPLSLMSSTKGKNKATSAVVEGGHSHEYGSQNRRSGKHRKIMWTEQMDNHLWATYLNYLQDPTVTPFKTLPGSAPPIGVCYRVAREAKKTWRGSKHALRAISETGKSKTQRGGQASENVKAKEEAADAIDSPNTIKGSRSGSSTPTAPTTKHYQWPESGPATRRRLAELCKGKPSIAPHYQRMMRNSSPIDRSSSGMRSRSSRLSSPFDRRNQRAQFSTRDFHISLTTSTSDTMQPNGALAQLARSASSSTEQQYDEDWFNSPVEPTSALESTNSHEGLGIDGLDDGVGLPRLGSPFGYHTWGPGRSRALFRPSSPRTQSDNLNSQGPSLRSPVQLQRPLPLPTVLKRRAQHQLEDELSPGGTEIDRELLEDMFGAPAESSHRRVRSRGFSLGDVNEGGRLSSLFTPPTVFDQMNSSEFAETRSFGSNLVPPAAPAMVRRLGSPFSCEEPSARAAGGSSRHGHSSSNTFPRSSHAFQFASSIDERLDELDQDEASRKRMKG